MSVVNEAIKAIETSQEEAAKKITASLQMLMQLSESKKNDMLRILNEHTENAVKRHEIPPSYYLHSIDSINVMSSQGAASGITKSIDNLMHNAEKEWKDALSSIIEVALNTLLGNASGASAQTNAYIIALDGHEDPDTHEKAYTPVRIDYCIWTYDLKSVGLLDIAQNALVCVSKKSLLDYSNIDISTVDQMLISLGISKKSLRQEIIEQIKEDKKNDNSPVNLNNYANLYNLTYQLEVDYTKYPAYQFYKDNTDVTYCSNVKCKSHAEACMWIHNCLEAHPGTRFKKTWMKDNQSGGIIWP